MNENEWVDIIGFDGNYKINKAGDVFSVRSNRIPKSFIGGNGYKLCNFMQRW